MSYFETRTWKLHFLFMSQNCVCVKKTEKSFTKIPGVMNILCKDHSVPQLFHLNCAFILPKVTI